MTLMASANARRKAWQALETLSVSGLLTSFRSTFRSARGRLEVVEWSKSTGNANVP